VWSSGEDCPGKDKGCIFLVYGDLPTQMLIFRYRNCLLRLVFAVSGLVIPRERYTIVAFAHERR
jgi:hypothetical protein